MPKGMCFGERSRCCELKEDCPWYFYADWGWEVDVRARLATCFPRAQQNSCRANEDTAYGDWDLDSTTTPQESLRPSERESLGVAVIMAGGRGKFYAVRVGKKTGIYRTWEEADEQVTGYGGVEHQSFATYEEAVEYMSRRRGRGIFMGYQQCGYQQLSLIFMGLKCGLIATHIHNVLR
ncbi:hypothetical protein PIB30_006353 [Stylosanthes scabra]|uniref:Ribonuclease H1 N-terminal domain-containing protein n=1 Tax=Stylosanthes scabra TaxID=79078 RepID=A0ABU6S480_9FABA|nr:hypothetical protein [Stylosanthes scabra]